MHKLLHSQFFKKSFPPGVDLKNFFAPYALALKFCASKKPLKKLGVGVGSKWIELSL